MKHLFFRRMQLFLCSLTVLLLLSGLFVFTGASNAEFSEETCALTIEHLSGQGRYALAGAGRYALAGAEGSTLSADELAEVQDNVVQFDASYITAIPQIQDYINNSPSPLAPAAILVVDDFFSFPLDDDGHYTMPHGRQVAAVIYEFIDLLISEGVLPNFNTILVQEVDISDHPSNGGGGYSGDVVANRIDSAIQTLQGLGYQHFIINMSFSMIPCSDPDTGFDFFEFLEYRRTNQQFLEDPETEDLITGGEGEVFQNFGLEQYLTEVLGLSDPQGYLAELLSFHCETQNLPGLQPLLSDYLAISADPGEDLRVIPIASSGNYGDLVSDPFAPACWPETIAVSASVGSDPNNPDLWEYSQDGNIIAPGAWHFDAFNNFYRAGTSFSAPFISTIAGLFMTYLDVPCEFDGVHPPLVAPNTLGNAILSSEPLACGTNFSAPVEDMPEVTIIFGPNQAIISGGTANFSVSVQNTGNIPITVQNVVAPGTTCGGTFNTTLQPNQSLSSYNCIASNVLTTTVFTATVNATSALGPVNDSDPATVTVINPNLSIVIGPDQTVFTGETANFNVTVTNTGPVILTELVVSVAGAPDCFREFASLAPSGAENYACSVPNMLATTTFTALVSATLDGNDTAASDTVTVTVTPPPSAGVSISFGPDQTIPAGTDANFSYSVTNSGDVPLVNLFVNVPDTVDCASGPLNLNPGQVFNVATPCRALGLLQSRSFTATVEGTAEGGAAVSASDSAAVTVESNPAIAITKDSDVTVPSGSDVTFTIRVSNTGNVHLSNIVVDDPLTPSCSQGIAGLTAGTFWEYTCTATNVTETFTNTASAAGLSPLQEVVNASDSATVTVQDDTQEPVCQDGGDPEADLTGVMTSTTTGVITNNSTECAYDVGLASYKKYGDSVDDQEIHDSQTTRIQPGEQLTLVVTLPECAAQVDLFYGPLITPTFNGQRYGERLLDVRHTQTNRGFCTPDDTGGEEEDGQ